MSRSIKHTRQQTRLILEELEERRLFSGGVEGLLETGTEQENDPLFRDLHEAEEAASGVNRTAAAAAEEVRREVAFVDAGVEDYQMIVNDLQASMDPGREIEVIVLDRDRDGIKQISEALKDYDNLDAIHIISHGGDGSLELGNSRLDAEALERNNLDIALWSNAFSNIGDILIYGCDLAATEAGQSLIDELGTLTLTDVAASSDLTGAAEFGGDWLLEYRAGSIESSVAVSAELQREYQATLATFTVTNLADSGAGSLRQAISDANSSGGADTIEFAVSGTIALSSQLPQISEQVDIDGTTAPGYAGEPVVILDGSSAGNVHGLRFNNNADNSSVSGLSIVNFNRNGIQTAGGTDGMTITDNWIGTTGNGSTGVGNGGHGMNLQGATNTVTGNVISNNGNIGINLNNNAAGTVVQGNIIGLDPDGTGAAGNGGVGIRVRGGVDNTIIGGTGAGEGNVVSSNNEGMLINSDGNIVQGNLVGTDITGTLDRGNSTGDGIQVQNGDDNLIGGTAAGAGNLVAFTGDDGIEINNGDGNTLLGNQVYASGDDDFRFTGGANNNLAAPTLTSADADPGQTDIDGSISADPNSYYRIEFFGEDGAFLGFENVATDGAGNATFNASLATTVDSGTTITATATASDVTYSTFTDSSLASAGVTAVRQAPWAFDDPGDFSTEIQNLNPPGYWRLGDSGGGATDLGSAGNAGTYVGVTLGQSGALTGDGDTAAYFDGSSYVEILHDPAYLIDEGTIQAWFNVDDATAGRQHIFSKDGSGLGTGGHVSLAIDPSGQLEVRLQDTSGDYWVTSTVTVTAGVWHHAAFTFGADGMHLYLDGVEVASNAYTGGLGTSSGGAGNFEDIAIGAGTRNSGSPDVTPVTELFTGTIDEVALFDTQLDAQTILQIANARGNVYDTGENGTLGVAAADGVLANDFDEQGDPLSVTEVNGSAATVGNQITLASGALLTLNADGSLDYDPNGQFESLAVGASATDSFTYTVDDGGGNTDTATVTVTINGENDDPVITSAATASVAENTTVVTTVTATDIDGDTPGFSISGGADQSFFSIDSVSGALSFNVAPDFDAPADSGADNVYEVDVTAADGNGGFDTQTISVTVTNVSDSVTALDDAYTVDEDSVLDSSAGWFDTDWQYRRTLSFDNSARSENFVDFPVLITLDSSSIDYGKTHDQGDDLRFYDQDGTALSHEIEVWDESGTSYVWVKIPQIDANSDTDSIVMYYGNAGVASDGQDPAGVWSDYVAAYHLNEDPGAGGTVVDSAGSYDATNSGSSDTAGVIGAAQDFDGSSHVDLGDNRPWINNASGASLSIWMNTDTTSGSGDLIGLSRGDPADTGSSRIALIRNGDDIQMIGRTMDDNSDSVNLSTSTSPLNTGQWHHITGTIDYSSDVNNLHIYVDGVLVATGSHDFTLDAIPNTDSRLATIGSDEDGTSAFFDGQLDEARISDSVRSADFISAQYAAMTGNLVNIGYEQTVAGVLVNDIDDEGNALTVTEVDGVPAAVGTPTALASGAIVTLNADGSFTYDTNGAFDYLAAGSSTTDTFTYRAEDAAGDWDTATVTITIDGLNDTPVIGGTDTGSVTEDVAVSGGNITASGSMTIADADTGESSFQAATLIGTYGSLTIDASGNWTYNADNSQAAIQALDVGESLLDTLTVTTFDGSTHDVVITINGAEDAPVIGGVATGTVAEDGTLTASDTLTITDTDTSDNPIFFNDVAPTLGDNGYGNFEITSNTWTYTLNNAHASVQALDVGESMVDTYTFTANDGSTQTVTVTINGAEDASVIGGVATGAVTEDGTLTASDTLTITDVDTSDNPVFFNDVAPTLGDNGYGSFEITSNTWTYTLNNAHASVQALDVGESLNDTYTFTASDGSTQTVTVTINGAEDAPVIGGVATGTVAEDGTLTASDTLTITDTDTSDNPIFFNDVAPTPGDNGYGNFEITSNTWTYTLNNAHVSVQALDVGESMVDTYTFTANDGSTRTVTVTINGAEDAPVIGGVATGTVAEDGTLTASDTLTITDTDTSDNPIFFNDVAPTLGDSGYGNFEITGNTWTYTLNNAHAAVQALDSGESLADTYTFTANDGSTQTVTVTIDGAEDASVIGGVATGSVTEDGTLTASDTLTITDVDTSDNPVFFNDVAPTLGDNGYGNFEITSNTWTYTLNNAHAAVQALDVGESLVDTHTFTASDGSTQTVTVTINGAEDAPVIGGVATGTVAEDGTLTASDTLTITDTDASDNPIFFNDVAPTLGDNGYGDFEITSNTWTYTLNNAHASVQALDVGESLIDSYTFTANDGSTQTVTVTINGAEDAPAIGGVATGSVTEDGTLTASNTLTITDVDTSDNPVFFNDVAPTLGDNGYGDFEITSNTWTYTLNNAHGAVQALDAGETLIDTYTFAASDGSTQTVTITINGADAAPVIGGVATGSVAEDGTLTASDTLTITDEDASDNPIFFVDVAPTLGDNGYGNFEITSNTWTYTLNNAHAAVQALDVGETLNDTYTFTANDGSTQVVTVTINGAEDAPVIGGVATGSVTEDGTLTASDTLTITDVDTSDNPVFFNDVAPTLGDNGYGNFEITGNTWTYTLNNAHAAVQALDVGEILNDTYTFTASDGSAQTVTVTVNGAEDAPVIGGVATGTVAEDGALTASDTLTITDTDTSDNPIFFNDVAPTLGDNGYGNFEITGNTWTYTLNNAHASVQALDDGETLNDTYTFTANDGSTQVVTVTINGAEDAPVIGGVATGTVAEDGTLTASDTLTITDTDTSDNPIFFVDVAPTLGDNGYGDFEITGNTWTYTLNNGHATVQALDVGETLNDTYTFTANDGSTQTVTVTINGAEDAPVIGGVATGSVTEDGTLTASDTLTITDVDTSDNPVFFDDVAPTLGDNGYGDFEITSNTWTYTLNNAHAAVQALDAGETLIDTYTFTASDGSTQTVTITINGADAAPVIGGVATGTVAEDGTLTASDTLTISDEDASDNPIFFVDVAPTLGDNGYGNFEITSNTWTYTLNNAHPSVQALDVGESMVDTFTFTANDGSTQVVTVTINGAEDAPVIGGVATGSVTEDGALTASDTLTITDVDASDNPIFFVDVAPTLGDNGYGNFEITGNTWTYTLNNAHAAVQALDVGESMIDTYTFTANDGSTQVVTVTINGAEDAPVIGGVAIGAVSEDGTLTASDTLTITDTDTSDNPIFFNDVAPTLGDNGYGNFEITGNTWTYTLNNAHAAVQALDVGESLNDTYTFTANDGSTQVVTVTINGAEDAPVIGGVATGSVSEDGTLTVTDTLSITDVDTSDNPIFFVDVAPTLGDNGYGNFEITGNTWTYTLNNGHAAVQALDVGESLVDTYTFTANDGSTQTVTVTINGAEDAPVIGGVATGTVTEDGTLTASDTLTITDVDTSDNPVFFNDVVPTLGDNGYGNFEITGNTWTYTLDNAHTAVQALDVGESLNDTYTFTASDGSTQVVTVTINGAEDAPVIGGVATGGVTEDGTLTATDTLTITDVDTSDNPIFFVDVAPTLGDNGYGDFEITGNTWTYTLNNGHAAVQALDVGETLNDTFTFTASDGSTQVVTVTINGTEDAPVIGGVATGSVAEDGTLTATDTLTISDVDTSDNPIFFVDVAPTLGDNGYGDFEITGNTWTYTLNNAHAAVQALDVGESMVDTFTFTASDGSTQVVTVTINGAEDAPVLGGVVIGSVTEDGALTATDTLTITDIDTSDNPIFFNNLAPTPGDNGYGDFEISGNTWTYTLNNGHAAVQALDVGESLLDTYTFVANDGSTQTVTVTVNGAEDAPVIGGVATGSVTEDGALIVFDTLTITDVDTSDNPVFFVDQLPTLGDNGYGDFEITANTWTYTLNNAHAAVQALDSGQSLVDTITFTASDGSTQVVSVVISGTDEAPVVTSGPPPVIDPTDDDDPPPGYVPPVDDDDDVSIEPPPDDDSEDIGSQEVLPEYEVPPQPREPAPEPVVFTEAPVSGSVADVAYASYGDAPVRNEPEPPLEIDKLELQVSDDEAVNQRYELALLKKIELMQLGFDDTGYRSADDVKVQILMGTTATLTAGIVSWVLRSGSLLASLMSTVPLLNRFDLLPILKHREEQAYVDDDDDTKTSTETDITESESDRHKRADEMFSSAREEDSS